MKQADTKGSFTLSPHRLEKAADEIERLFKNPSAISLEEIARSVVSAYLGEDMVAVPLKLAQRVTSIARRNEDAPEIQELSALLSASLTERDAG